MFGAWGALIPKPDSTERLPGRRARKWGQVSTCNIEIDLADWSTCHPEERSDEGSLASLGMTGENKG